MFGKIRYWLWKRRARKAIEEGLIATCHDCNDPIVPGDFIAVGEDKGKPILVHAGYHFAISNMCAFCESGGCGSAHWDGKRVVFEGESMIAAAIRTGEAQVR